jgi:hypothetical protein
VSVGVTGVRWMRVRDAHAGVQGSKKRAFVAHPLHLDLLDSQRSMADDETMRRRTETCNRMAGQAMAGTGAR